MAEQLNELKKLAAISADLELSTELRTRALQRLGSIGSHEALLVLLQLVANDKITKDERELALKQAGKILKSVR